MIHNCINNVKLDFRIEHNESTLLSFVTYIYNTKTNLFISTITFFTFFKVSISTFLFDKQLKKNNIMSKMSGKRISHVH